MKKFKKVAGIVLAATCACSITACARSAETGSAVSNNANSVTSIASAIDSVTTVSAPTGTKVAGTDTIKIGFSASAMDLNNVAWDKGIQDEVSQYKNIEYQSFDAQSTAETQTSQFEDMINQGYDAIIVNPCDATALASVTDEAEKAGVNVIGLNMGPDTTFTALVAAAGPNYEGGEMCAKDAEKRLNGTGNCVVISAPTALLTVIHGGEGFTGYIKESCPNMKVLGEEAGDWTTEKANTIMRDFLTKYNNDIQCVFCQNDQMAIGAAQAIDAAGLTGKILVYGVDGTDEGLQYIKEGKMTGTVYCNSENMGTAAAQVALYAIQTGTSATGSSVTPKISVPSLVITADNISDYE